MAGPSAAAFTELLKEPFGPYWETEALSKAVKKTTVKNPVSLRGLILESGGVFTGLSECEVSMPEYNNHRFSQHPVRFMGTIEIRSLSWLTPEVAQHIETEVRERDVQARRSPSNPHPRPSNLTLKTLYAPSPGFRTGRYKVKVKIQAWACSTASYLLSKDVPDGLRISSRDRNYTVVSMLINTYELSRLYLSRYRLLACLERLAELETSAGTAISFKERTPDWYIDAYFKHYAYHSSGRQYRTIHAESDSDIEPGTNGRMKSGREHPLRHVSRAEMESWFAQHAVWLIKAARASKHSRRPLFDPDKWQQEWLPEVRCTREEAAQAGRRWGVWEGSEVPTEDIDDIPLPPAPSRRKRRATKKSKRSATGMMPSSAFSYATASSASPYNGGDVYDCNAMDVDWQFPDPTSLRTYDPDISGPSSENEAPPTTTDDDDEQAVDPGLLRFTDPEIVALLPPSFRHPPPLPPSHKWKCSECDYVIDLLKLTPYELDNPAISYRTREALRSKRWNMFKKGDEWVYNAFVQMVEKHHREHLEERGIEFRKTRGGWMAEWKDGRRPEFSRLRQVKVDDRRQKATVKTEEL
ncbi:hypothetical protein C8T65DRAFT_6385 [Cerioporus squamosus]|nr:hypothetical protein C8T65DRAFT_6385 [Cerioporus squamosus]